MKTWRQLPTKKPLLRERWPTKMYLAHNALVSTALNRGVNHRSYCTTINPLGGAGEEEEPDGHPSVQASAAG